MKDLDVNFNGAPLTQNDVVDALFCVVNRYGPIDAAFIHATPKVHAQLKTLRGKISDGMWLGDTLFTFALHTPISTMSDEYAWVWAPVEPLRPVAVWFNIGTNKEAP